MNYKERPRCREHIEGLLEEGYTLQELIFSHQYPPKYWKHRGLSFLALSDGLKKQAKKMLEESGGK